MERFKLYHIYTVNHRVYGIFSFFVESKTQKSILISLDKVNDHPVFRDGIRKWSISTFAIYDYSIVQEIVPDETTVTMYTLGLAFTTMEWNGMEWNGME